MRRYIPRDSALVTAMTVYILVYADFVKASSFCRIKVSDTTAQHKLYVPFGVKLIPVATEPVQSGIRDPVSLMSDVLLH
jgi:hypothetical protein